MQLHLVQPTLQCSKLVEMMKATVITAAVDRSDRSVDGSISSMGSIDSIDSIFDWRKTLATRVSDDLQLSIFRRRKVFCGNIFRSKNLLTERSIFGHFVPAMGSRNSPPKAGAKYFVVHHLFAISGFYGTMRTSKYVNNF